MTVLLYCFLSINCLAFLVTAYDKRLAIKNRRRISEKTLLSFVAFGGSIGAALAMMIFRHKTSKKSYLLKFTGIVVLQMLLFFTAYSMKL